jgi:hypothetical protein
MFGMKKKDGVKMKINRLGDAWVQLEIRFWRGKFRFIFPS